MLNLINKSNHPVLEIHRGLIHPPPIYQLKLEMKILTRADRDTKEFSVPLIRPYAKENFTLLQEATIKEIEIKAEFTNGYDRLRVEGTISEPDVKLGNEVAFDLAQEYHEGH